MNYTQLVEKSWQYVRKYRALWLFGIFVALTTSSWGTGTLYGLNDESRQNWFYVELSPGEEFSESMERAVARESRELERAIREANAGLEKAAEELLQIEIEANILPLFIGIAVTLITAYLVSRVIGYLGRTALIKMVDDYEKTAKQSSVRQGFRLGWSRASWRLFVIDLLITIPLIILGLGVMALFALIIMPQFALIGENAVAGFAALTLTGSLFLVFIFIAVMVAAGLSMAMPLVRRSCVIENLGVVPSMRRGAALVKTQFQSVKGSWLIAVGVRVAYPLVVAPIILLLAAVGILLGGLAALLVGGIGYLLGAANFLISASVVGALIVLFVLISGVALLGGLVETFLSALWTLTYRELRGLAPQEKASKSAAMPGEAAMKPAVTS